VLALLVGTVSVVVWLGFNSGFEQTLKRLLSSAPALNQKAAFHGFCLRKDSAYLSNLYSPTLSCQTLSGKPEVSMLGRV